MRGTARNLSLWSTAEPDDLHRAIRDMSRSNALGRPRSIAELNALAELEHSPVRLDLATWEGLASGAHSIYREKKHAPYADVHPEVLARGVGVRLVYKHGLWQSSYNPDTRIAQIAPRADALAQAFDTFHETAEALCAKTSRASHADAQWTTIALMVERDVAARALRVHGLRGGVAELARTHRRIRRCFLWVRLAMVAAAAV